jgi:hypothetical protein
MYVPVIFGNYKQHPNSDLVCRESYTSIRCICLWAFDISMKINFLVKKTKKRIGAFHHIFEFNVHGVSLY